MKKLKVEKFVIDHVVRKASMEVDISDNVYDALTEDECNAFVTKVIESANASDDLVWEDIEIQETEHLEVIFEEMT